MCVACGIATHIPDVVPETASVGPSAALGRFAALHHADARNYLVGATLSMAADNVEHVITYWVLFVRFHSPVLAGFAVIAHWVPALLFSVHFGALADRHDCRKVIQASQLLYMVVSAIWGLLFLTNSLQVWHAVVLLIMHGMAGALWAPAEQLMLHDIVGPKELPSAIRLNATFRNLGLLMGPGIGAILLLALGPTAGIFANVLIYLPLTLWLLRTPVTGHLRAGIGRRPALGLGEVPRVLEEVMRQPVLLSMVAVGGLSALFIGTALQPQVPEFAQDLGMRNAGLAYGALMAASAAGAVIGGFLLEGTGALKGSPRAAVVSALLWGVFTVGFAAAHSYALALVLLLAAGVANLACVSIAQTLVQLLAAPEQRGRIVGVFNMFSSGLRAGSGVTVGVLGGAIGIHWSLGLSSAALVVCMAWLLIAMPRGSRVAAALVPGTDLPG